MKHSKKEDIVLEDGVYYMEVNGKKVPIDIDAPPKFRANKSQIMDSILEESGMQK